MCPEPSLSWLAGNVSDMAIARTDVKAVDPATATAATEAVNRLRDLGPAELAAPDVQRDRRSFLEKSLRDTRAPEEIERIYERIIGGNDLMPVRYLQRGATAARAVARIDLGGGSFGTGFLIAPRVLITNNHVFPNAATAASAQAQFHYEVDLNDTAVGPVVVELRQERFFLRRP